jgi:hypothetical protein
MVILDEDRLEFHFPEVHNRAKCSIEFQRTLRIPDDNREYPLPPGLGRFPLCHLVDYEQKIPEDWRNRGGVFFPMHQSEAMWINFDGDYPCAVKVATGKINAVSGKPWTNELSGSHQDYVVVPDQRWMDGFCVAKGLIRQFVAMPLGEGFSVEEQLTGMAKFGGLQLCVYPMKRDFYDAWQKEQEIYPIPTFMRCQSKVEEPSPGLGLASGGLMRQEVYKDNHGLKAWDYSAMMRCFIHLVNSEQFHGITGYAPPNPPPSAQNYTNAGLPWFDYYDADNPALEGALPLAKLDSVAAKMIKFGKGVLQGNNPVEPKRVVVLGPKKRVSDGQW